VLCQNKTGEEFKMAGLKRDNNGVVLQGFAPYRAEDITASVVWTPGTADTAFCVPSACTYTLNGSGSSMSLQEGAIRVLMPGYTYTFDTTQVIEVM